MEETDTFYAIKKKVKQIDEEGNEYEVEVTEYPNIPVVVVENEGE